MREKMKIIFLGYYDVNNLGDPIIAHCTEWLYRKYISIPLEVRHVNLNCVNKHVISERWQRLIYKMLKRLKKKNAEKFKDQYFLKKYIKYYESQIDADTDFIVVVGGGMIKYKVQFCFASLCGLIKVAEKKGIPVILNAVGVEGFDKNNFRCRELKKALHFDNLKYISVRDDLETLIKNYFDGIPSIPCCKVADPAVWSSETFGIKKTISSTIGIGIGRKGLFKDYGKAFSDRDYLELTIQLVTNLIKQGFQIELFTNGALLDNKYAQDIHKLLSDKGITVKLIIPNSPKELINTISTFHCIVAPRLHSCIVAYSLGVPAIGLVWNEKLIHWGKNINAEELYINTDEMNVETIMRKFKKLETYNYDESKRILFRNTIEKSVKDVVENIIGVF